MKNSDYLGKKIKCKVTGFKGICVSVVYYLNGCTQLGIRPPVGKDGKITEAEYIDIQEADVVSDGITIGPKSTGGPQRDCPKR